MFNNTSMKLGDVTNNVTFNSPCIGMIQRSHPKSKFIRFHKNSNMADWVFSDKPRLREFTEEQIIVLQLMVFGDNEFLMEYVEEKDCKEAKNESL